MKDFTSQAYRRLIIALKQAGFRFLTMADFAEHQGEKVVCLRHDVDLRAVNSLHTAELENELGVCATYYFRVVPESNQPDIIRRIAELGHEIGYHYEDMSIADGDVSKAYAHFCEQLAYFRTFYPVRTICMHGAPTSRYDGRDLWKTYEYHALGITCEPYLDLDYSKVLYLTDTGRCWDGYNVSVRDKIPVWQDDWTRKGLTFRTTGDILLALSNHLSPLGQYEGSLLFTTHPQRWTDSSVLWLKELLLQSAKNIVKRALIKLRN